MSTMLEIGRRLTRGRQIATGGRRRQESAGTGGPGKVDGVTVTGAGSLGADRHRRARTWLSGPQ